MSTPSQQELSLDRTIARIDKQFNVVRLLTPTNLHSEQAKFLAGEIENPRFTYRSPGSNLHLLVAELDRLHFPKTFVGRLLYRKAQETQDKLRMLMAIGTEQFSQLAKKIYGVPDATIIKDAHELMRTTNPLQPKSDFKQPRLTSNAVAADLRDILHQYGLDDWRVQLTTDIISGVIVAASQKTVYVHAHTSLELTRLAPIITHEIETHVLTTVNGAAQPLELFVQGFAGYTRTQEGLASYNVEWRHPELFHRPARFWSRNALAVDVSLRGSFRDVFSEMQRLGFNPHFSYGVAAKVKRGLTETDKPGGFTKDYLYLAGRRDIMNYVATGGDLRDLYVGKILLSDLPELKKEPWLVPPKTLPNFLRGSYRPMESVTVSR
ncbi:MAG: DUF1704 domain-containing protein [Candidatus Andersenbacteria bacterium]